MTRPCEPLSVGGIELADPGAADDGSVAAPRLIAAVTGLLTGFGAGLEDDAAVLAVSGPR
ncbi:hypothetical protein LV75_003632 [Actinokineospora diospyrosa]|uniref:Uncharacterized protein n=1 Tax=Actinokineospora diospyrosa TaxID=103728 RepID=A0ABT1IEP8_9PSEU|nr:hypothetical protein [Actinokineospora diospyrosa]